MKEKFFIFIKKYKLLIILAVILGLFIWANIAGEKIHHNQILNQSTITTKVVRVIDGDTLIVHIDNQDETVRFIAMDTPETVDPRKPVECYGKEASDHSKETLTGKTITLESDPTQDNTDKYERLLRYIFLADGTNYNLSLVQQGFAREYTYFGKAYEYQAEFRAAQAQAKKEKLGVWNCPNPFVQ